MDRTALLSPTDVHTIRRYVHTKYAPLPQDRRVKIVADAIRRALQQRLPSIPEELKEHMVDQLINRCLVSERREILPNDVLELCAELDYDGPNREELLLKPILEWVNEYGHDGWSAEQLSERFQVKKEVSQIGRAETSYQPGWRQRIGKALRAIHPSAATLVVLTIAIGIAAGATHIQDKPAADPLPVMPIQPVASAASPEIAADVGMPAWLTYTEIDTAAVKAYLTSRDSMLADDPYFEAIMASAREYDLHPLLLLAITGQEQGFVPKSAKEAKKIANNPFNVGHSWIEYNTDIYDSTGIASRLLVKLADSRPEGHEPFSWFNKTYAEDPLWSDGVRKIFHKLNNLPSVDP